MMIWWSWFWMGASWPLNRRQKSAPGFTVKAWGYRDSSLFCQCRVCLVWAQCTQWLTEWQSPSSSLQWALTAGSSALRAFGKEAWDLKLQMGIIMSAVWELKKKWPQPCNDSTWGKEEWSKIPVQSSPVCVANSRLARNIVRPCFQKQQKVFHWVYVLSFYRHRLWRIVYTGSISPLRYAISELDSCNCHGGEDRSIFNPSPECPPALL